MAAVVRNLHALGRVAQSVRGFAGPHLGAKLATKVHRQFSAQQLAMGAAAPSKWLSAQQSVERLATASTKKPVDAEALVKQWLKPSAI